MGEYIPPSELSINQPQPRPAERSPQELERIRLMVPQLIGRLFAERSDLVTMVDFVHSSNYERQMMPQHERGFRRFFKSTEKETLIPVRKSYVAGTQGSYHFYAHDFSKPLIAVNNVQPYYHKGQSFSGYGVYHDGISEGTYGVLLDNDSTVYHPSTGKRSTEVMLHRDRERNCIVACGYTERSEASGYQFAENLARTVQLLLNKA